MLASAAHGCELARVPCSSWRRPLAFTPPCPAHPAAFALAFVQDRAVQIRRRRPPPCSGTNPKPSVGAPNAEGKPCGLPAEDEHIGQDVGGGFGGGMGRSGALASSATSACGDGPLQQDVWPGQALGGAVASGNAASAGEDGDFQQGPGLAQPYALHAPHHGLDVTCVLALPMADAAREAGALSAARAVTARVGSDGVGGFCAGPSLPVTAVVTGSDDGALRRLVHGGRCAGEPCLWGSLHPAQSPQAAAEGPREAGATRDGAGEASVSGRRGAWDSAEDKGRAASVCSAVWGSAEVGSHVGGTTVKALAAVPWPPGSGAPALH